MDFELEERKMITELGFIPGWLGDVKEGDEVIIPSVMRSNLDGTVNLPRIRHVERINPTAVPDHDEDGNTIGVNIVIGFVFRDEDGIPEIKSYGSSYPCYYRRIGENNESHEEAEAP